MNLRRTSEKTLGITIKAAVWLVLIVILCVLGVKGFQFGEKVFSEKGMAEAPGEDRVITIVESDSNMDGAVKAVEAGLAEDKWVFYVQSLLYEAKFKPYAYTINNSLPAESIIEILSEEPTTAEEEK